MRPQSVRVRNFKAIVDSKTVKLGPLTALIGNNGTGKSSLIEALETYQIIVRDGLDIAICEQSGYRTCPARRTRTRRAHCPKPRSNATGSCWRWRRNGSRPTWRREAPWPSWFAMTRLGDS